MKKRNNGKGFTLIELLIVVAIIGIIVAIAIPNLLNAIQRSKQKRSMADARTVGTAVEAYAIDFNMYPSAAAVPPFVWPSGLSMPSATFGGLGAGINKLVTPTYQRLLPLKDGWGTYFLYGTGTSNNQHYCIASYGKDGAVSALSGSAETTNFNDDIIFVDGQFGQYPAGAQN